MERPVPIAARTPPAVSLVWTGQPVVGISQDAGVTDPDIPQHDDPTARTKYVPAREAVTGGFSKNADLISYIVAGLLLGLLLDWVLGTTPVMVIIWTLFGVGVGYWRLWQSSAELEEQAKDRSHGV